LRNAWFIPLPRRAQPIARIDGDDISARDPQGH
jgi:hypothetical protein